MPIYAKLMPLVVKGIEMRFFLYHHHPENFVFSKNIEYSIKRE